MAHTQEMAQVARELVRAVRGERSQEALSRRLGYTSNPVADWEAGRRFPTASEFLRACTSCGVDVLQALERFAPEEALALAEPTDEGVAAWLRALRGKRSINELSERVQASRYAVSRWLKGETRPRLPHFLKLIDALTSRLPDWVALLVPIQRVPSLTEVHRERHASRTLAFEEPWTEAILRVLETRAYQRLPAHLPGWIADQLGLSLEIERRCLAKLEQARVLSKSSSGHYHSVGTLTVDTRADPRGTRRLKAHWAALGLERAHTPRPGDLVSYNVVSVSQADLARIREAHVRYFHEVRQIVAQSHPEEVAAVINIQLLTWS